MASLTSRVARCEHGRMLRHDPEPTAAIAATSGRPCGLHTTASHTGGMVAPSDPGVRATQVGGFIFGRTDPSQNVIQVQAVKAGITTITGVLMGRSDGFPHSPPAKRNPPLYQLLKPSSDPRDRPLGRPLWPRRPVPTQKAPFRSI